MHLVNRVVKILNNCSNRDRCAYRLDYFNPLLRGVLGWVCVWAGCVGVCVWVKVV